MSTMTWLLAIGLVAGAAGGATAPARAHGHTGHAHTGHAAHSHSRGDTSATREFKAAHARMMRNMKVPFTGDPDVDFRTHMIPHHQGAIDMSRVALRHAKEPWSRQVAEAITIAQPREIYEFQGWLASRGAMVHGRARPNKAATREFKAAHARMMRNMAMPFTGDPDVDLRMHMIPHHQGAIDMARVALRHAKDPWTRQAAEAIIIAQQQEIYQFQTWLARRGAMVPPGGQPRYIIGANSYPELPRGEETDEKAGRTGELIGQTWAPGSGVPPQGQVSRP
jgi:uncharacterized protein (DUF305 family)